ncbi:MAG: type II toxin-antitoxin system VapC family toxin [Thermomicrobiales bacterium]
MTSQPVANPRRVFVDTSAYFALVNDRDIDYPRVLAIATRLTAEGRRLFTTNFVLAETHAMVLRRLGREVAVRVLDEIDQGSAKIVRVSARDERRARQIVTRYTDKDFSLTDALSFAVMERLRIAYAFTLDDDFAQYGYQIVD